MAFLFAESAVELGGEHDWLGLLPSSHPHGEFLSDLAGYDLFTHDGTPESIIPPVLAWLKTRADVGPIPPNVNPGFLSSLMTELQQLVEAQELQWGKYLPFADLIGVIRDVVASRV